MSKLYHAIQLPLFKTTKVCPTCNPPTEKPIDDFYCNRTRADGRASQCKACQHLHRGIPYTGLRQYPPRKQRIIEMLQEGCSYAQIVQEVGCCKGTISFHAKHLGLSTSRSVSPFNWKEVQQYYDEGNSVRACIEHFSMSNQTWRKALRKGWLKAESISRVLTPETLFTENSPHTTSTAKFHLYAYGLREKQCEECGITGWNGKPIVIELHHINGVNTDHRLENLQLLCPNCHSQTPNYRALNKHAARPKKPRKSDQIGSVA